MFPEQRPRYGSSRGIILCRSSFAVWPRSWPLRSGRPGLPSERPRQREVVISSAHAFVRHLFSRGVNLEKLLQTFVADRFICYPRDDGRLFGVLFDNFTNERNLAPRTCHN